MTFYEGLNEFEARYLNALAKESKRVIDVFDQDWQTINNEFNCYTAAISEGKNTEAADHIQNILDILVDNGITVTTPVTLPLPPGVSTTPSSVPIVCESDGTPDPTAYTNASSIISIYLGFSDDTANWTYVISSQTDATATNLVADNQIDITAITADSGTIEVTCSKAGYDDFVVTVTTYKVNKGVDSYMINANPVSINIPIVGTPVYTGAVSYLSALIGNVDDTTNWTFAIDSVSDVTANIASGNELWITNIATDQGYVDVEASKAGYDSVIIRIPVYKLVLDMDHYTTDPVLISKSFTSSAGETETPAASSNNLYVAVELANNVSPTLSVRLDNYENVTGLPIFISVYMDAAAYTGTLTVFFRDSSNNNIAVMSRLDPATEYWGFILMYAGQTLGGNNWYLLSEPAQQTGATYP